MAIGSMRRTALFDRLMSTVVSAQSHFNVPQNTTDSETFTPYFGVCCFKDGKSALSALQMKAKSIVIHMPVFKTGDGFRYAYYKAPSYAIVRPA